MRLEDLADMTLFVHIVERGSLSAAGRALGLPKATVSRRLALMERRVGAPLLHRSTRALTPTDLGRRHFERIVPIVREATAAQAELLAGQAAPAGLVRVTAPVAWGQSVLGPVVMAFLAEHPAVRVDLRLTDERVSLIPVGVDLAIRMGALEDSELVARRIGAVALRLVAAPAFLSRHGAPVRPEDLDALPAILTRPDLDQWTLGAQTVRPAWRLSTGNMLVTRDAALAGVGVALLPAFLADGPIRDGALVVLLEGFPAPAAPVTALTPRTVALSPATLALVGRLAAHDAEARRGERSDERR